MTAVAEAPSEAQAVLMAYQHCRDAARDLVQRLEVIGPDAPGLSAAERHLAAAELQLAEARRQANCTPCPKCRRLMRPYRTTRQDYPETVARGATCCNVCYKAQRAEDPDVEPARPTTEENRANLRSWLVSMGWPGTSV